METTLPVPWARARFLLAVLVCLGGVAALLVGGSGLGEGAGGLGESTPVANRVSRAYGELPLSFQPNRGQVDRRVLFLSRGAGYGLFLLQDRAVLALGSPRDDSTGPRVAWQRPALLSMSLLGAQPDPAIAAAGRLPGRVSYLSGRDPRGWQTGIATFSTVRYSGVWPGIEVGFYGNQRRLEYDFRLSPGAEAGAIRLRFSGQRDIRIDRSGALLLSLGGRIVRQPPPHAYEVIDGERHRVDSHYVLLGGGRVGIGVGAHDPRRELIIDPQLVFSTYLGGAFKYGDNGTAIAVDAAGSAFVTGSSYYSRFPVTPGAFQTKSPITGGIWDTSAFVTKLDPSGSRLVYSTYLGGNSGENIGRGIAVDAAGNAYVAGHTTATTFPTTPGAFRTSGSGAFVTKLDPTGSALVYSTLLGDPVSSANAIALDPAGSAYVTGTGDTSAGFPTTPGAFRTSGSGAFVTKLDPTGSALVYSTLLGDPASDAAALALDAAGDAYVAGHTTATTFPTTPGAFRTSGSGAFVTKLDPTGSALVYSTRLGDATSAAAAIAVDPAGSAYVAGSTESTRFPVTPGAFQAAVPRKRNDDPVAFVAKLDPLGAKLIYGTYLGGRSHSTVGWGGATGVAIDAAGDAYVTGSSASTRFPTTTGALQRFKSAPRASENSGFVSELSPTGSRLLYSTYLGSWDTLAKGIALDSTGHVLVTGTTLGISTTPGAFQRKSHSGGEGYAAFVAELNPSGPPVAGLRATGVDRRGERVRLRGLLDPAARGLLGGGARGRHARAAIHVRRRRGRFVATTGSLAKRGVWEITIRFRGRHGWESETLCRKVHVGAGRPGRKQRLASKSC